MAAAAATLATGAPPALARPGPLRTVVYHRFTVRVPWSWPVIRLAANGRACVRFDRHALYLGVPGAQEDCPAHAVGRTEAILVQPLGALAHAGRAAAAGRPGLSGDATRFTVGRAGVLVTATWRSDRGLIARALGRRRLPGLPPARAAATRHAALRRAGARAASAAYVGKGFDACTAPSAQTMQAWAANSPYHAIGVYIGGVNAACPPGSGANPNLDSAWVSQEVAAGWHLIPTYVGLQAPSNSCCQGMSSNPGQAAAQGTAAANDAVADMQSLGLPAGNPIYYDMEYYSRTSTNTNAVLAFLSAWTSQLHAAGYASGVYGNSDSAIADLVSQWGTSYPEPDDIWFAEWNNQPTATTAYVPATEWSNQQRLHQYTGGHNETYGGATINIDSDYVDGATASTVAAPAPVPPPVVSVSPVANGTTTLTMSWPGGSGLSSWQVLGGSDPSALTPVSRSAPTGSSTRITFHGTNPYFAVQALDSSGQVLASSQTVATPSHLMVYGRSAFVYTAGTGGVPVGCYTGSACHITTTVAAGRTTLVRTGSEYVAPGGVGFLYFTLRGAARARLLRAGKLAVTVSLRDASGASLTVPLTLVSFATSGRAPRRWVAAASGIRILGMTSFVSPRGIAGVLTACEQPVPCRISTTISLGKSVLARTGGEWIGANELGYLTYYLNSAGARLLAASRGNQVGVRATLAGGGGLRAVAGIVLTRF